MGLQSTIKMFKKSLGQNFFNNPTLADKIVDLIVQTSPESILEIGPGDGFFTQRFANKGLAVTAIEKDSSLIDNLKRKIPSANFIESDFMDYKLDEANFPEKTTVFGSLPYNIAKQIIRKFFKSSIASNFFFILQREVALKYSDQMKSSLIYMTTKLYADTKILLNINPGSFIPRPKVESSLVQMKRNSNIQLVNQSNFLQLVKLAYGKPRKTLRNNLKGQIEFEDKNQIFNKRAEDLKFTDFVALSNRYKCYNPSNEREEPNF